MTDTLFRTITTKIRDNRRMAGLLLLIALLIAIVAFPLRLVLALGPFGNGPMQAFSASGSIWDGKLFRANIGPVNFGDIDTSMRFWPLFVGRQSFFLETDDQTVRPGRAILESSIGGYRISDMNAVVPLDNLLAPLPAGQLRFEQFNVQFSGNRCLSASGRLQLTLRAFLPGFDTDEQLVGAPRCSEDRLLLPLANGAGTRMVNIYIDAGGGYRATLRMEAMPDVDPLILQGRGFEREGGRWQMQLGGQL